MFSNKQKWVGATAFAAVLISSSLTSLSPSQAAVPSAVSGIQATNIIRTNTNSKDSLQTQTYPGILSLQESLTTAPLNVAANPAQGRGLAVTTLALKSAIPVELETKPTSAQLGSDTSTNSSASKTVSTSQTPASVQASVSGPKQQAKPASSGSTKKNSAPAKQVQTAKASNPAQLSRGGSQVSSIIERALSLRGVPYLWGGTTPKGFDCSGFVQYVFAASGVKLPRTSFEQYKVGTPVARDQLQVGDVVFFSTYARGASDVRIYIGGGRTIGASSDGVAIHSLSESYWSKHYLGARRVL
ncbi:C40 family peptidase [Paradesulfitobacterium aromaticivorans]